MEFRKQKPIYLQIAETLCRRITMGEWQADGRIASARDVAVELGVNPNTVTRSFDYLQSEGIIYNKRGLGYFAAPDAKEKIIAAQRKEFIEEELPAILEKLHLLGISIADLGRLAEEREGQ